jgi:hypothetical protein
LKRYKPTYELSIVAELTKAQKIKNKKTVVNELVNHQYDVQVILVGVLHEISEGRARFHKTDQLQYAKGMFADIYYASYSDEEWYVKFYIEDGVIVLSCKLANSNW